MFIGQVRNGCVLKTEPGEHKNVTLEFPLSALSIADNFQIVEYELIDGVAHVNRVVGSNLCEYCGEQLAIWQLRNPSYNRGFKYV